MKLILSTILITFFLLGCSSKTDRLLGTWKVIELTPPSSNIQYPPLSALDPTFNKPEYNSHEKDAVGLLFYLTKEENAIITFNDNTTVNTTLFFANFGSKTYEFYPKLDTLKLKFIDPDSIISSTGEQIIYDGKVTFTNNNTIRWDLTENKSLILEREQ